MKAAILTIGDELTSGYRLDTNSQTIAAQLTPLPVDVAVHVSVGDAPAIIEAGLQMALEAADCVIVTGGLGPTEDDLTRQVISAYFGLELVENAEALERMVQRYVRRGRRMPESNRIQALVPRGCQIIQNGRGTAAGFYIQAGGKHVFVTPGIPFEMQGMLEDFILPRIVALLGGDRVVRQAFIKVYGLPESEINERIRPMVIRGRNPLLGLLPHQGTITIELTAYAENGRGAEELIQADVASLRDALGLCIISDDGRDLPQVVGDLLLERGLTISTAEEGTAGLLAARLTAPLQSQAWFRGGTAQSADSAAHEPQATSATREAAALGLARNARTISGADIAVGVGPVVFPPDSTSERPYGTVYVAVDLGSRQSVRELSFTRDRVRIREWVADAALAQVRLALLDAP